VVQYVESFEDEKYLYIVMEYCSGQELFKHIEQKVKFTEQEAASIIYKIIEALNHIHSLGIVHRDLKPENIMIDDEGNPKLLDFGLSKNTQGNSLLLKSVVGSKLFMAPEMLSAMPHTFTCDMWSLGIILFIMLSGSYPFDTRNLEHEIQETPIVFYPTMWKGISQTGKDFVMDLLDKNPVSRISAKKALEHEWFKQENADVNIA